MFSTRDELLNFGSKQIPNEVSTREMRRNSKQNGTARITEILYADDAALFFRSISSMQKALTIIVEELMRFGLILSLGKTETMAVNAPDAETTMPSLISFEEHHLKNTQNFKYLGLMTSMTNQKKYLFHHQKKKILVLSRYFSRSIFNIFMNCCYLDTN